MGRATPTLPQILKPKHNPRTAEAEASQKHPLPPPRLFQYSHSRVTAAAQSALPVAKTVRHSCRNPPPTPRSLPDGGDDDDIEIYTLRNYIVHPRGLFKWHGIQTHHARLTKKQVEDRHYRLVGRQEAERCSYST